MFYKRELSFLPTCLNHRECAKKPISRSAGSWGKVKIPKCADFDEFLEKQKKLKIFDFYLFFDDFRDYFYFSCNIFDFENPKKS